MCALYAWCVSVLDLGEFPCCNGTNYKSEKNPTGPVLFPHQIGLAPDDGT